MKVLTYWCKASRLTYSLIDTGKREALSSANYCDLIVNAGCISLFVGKEVQRGKQIIQAQVEA